MPAASGRNSCPVFEAGRHEFFREPTEEERRALASSEPAECARYKAALELKKKMAKGCRRETAQGPGRQAEGQAIEVRPPLTSARRRDTVTICVAQFQSEQLVRTGQRRRREPTAILRRRSGFASRYFRQRGTDRFAATLTFVQRRRRAIQTLGDDAMRTATFRDNRSHLAGRDRRVPGGTDQRRRDRRSGRAAEYHRKRSLPAVPALASLGLWARLRTARLPRRRRAGAHPHRRA